MVRSIRWSKFLPGRRQMANEPDTPEEIRFFELLDRIGRIERNGPADDADRRLIERWYTVLRKHVPHDALTTLPNQCSKCGLQLDGGAMGYVCPNAGCPTGMGGATC